MLEPLAMSAELLLVVESFSGIVLAAPMVSFYTMTCLPFCVLTASG